MEATATPTKTKTNTELVQQAYGYFAEGNIPALLDLLTDDVKWTVAGPQNILPWVGTRNGKQEVGEFFRLVDENNEFLTFEPREFIAERDKVVTLGYLEAKSKKTGRVSKTEWAMVFVFRNGKVCGHTQYSDTYDAAEAFKN